MPESVNELESRICAAVEAAFETLQVPFLERLVNQPSYTDSRQDVEAAAALIDELAKEIGLHKSLFPDPDEQYTDHRIFGTPALKAPESALALVGHCDTVYPRHMEFLGFRRDEKGHAFGPGVLDMKSGLTVILFALRALRESAPEVWKIAKLRFLLNTEEEVGSPSSGQLFEAIAPVTSCALVFEGGRDEDRIVTARKGTGGFTLRALGRSAHAGNDHAAGVNAIHALAYLIPHVEALTNYEAGTTVNVGVIQGGTTKNTVPDAVECLIDVRITNLEEMQNVQRGLEKISRWDFVNVDQVPAQIRTAKIELEGGISRPPMAATDASEKLRDRY
ncbi:MAG: M20/M25/M40 family metallo-hydrolase, partial [Pirellulaceae bacterium]|nr:M20/M25/M40 family metallo-hydrolase [Pirellulaceae bacterium]